MARGGAAPRRGLAPAGPAEGGRADQARAGSPGSQAEAGRAGARRRPAGIDAARSRAAGLRGCRCSLPQATGRGPWCLRRQAFAHLHRDPRRGRRRPGPVGRPEARTRGTPRPDPTRWNYDGNMGISVSSPRSASIPSAPPPSAYTTWPATCGSGLEASGPIIRTTRAPLRSMQEGRGVGIGRDRFVSIIGYWRDTDSRIDRAWFLDSATGGVRDRAQ
jgi:hypothetical protein